MEEQNNSYGDFQEKKEISKKNSNSEQPEELPVRIKMPGKNQLIGIVIQRLGGNKMAVQATDNKIRNCRVPGRFARRFWIRPNDIVLIEPWELDNTKADIVYHYKGGEANQVRKKGLLSGLKEEF